MHEHWGRRPVSLLDRPTLARVTMVWLVTRIFVLAVAAVGSREILSASGLLGGFSSIWLQWDTHWYVSIVEDGYQNPDFTRTQGGLYDFTWNGAFFPALPILMRLGGLLGLSPTAAGLLISLVASLVAGFALARLARDMGARPELAVLAWFVAPTAVFLTAAYTEALFCAFAFWAWVFARRQQWLAAGVLGGFAAFSRANGIFLGIGLVAMFLLARPYRWRAAWALLIPFAVTLGYFAYLQSVTGRWTAWFDIQRIAWSRQFTDPLTSLANTYALIFDYLPDGTLSTRFISEIVGMAILIALLVVVLARRWWAEGVYVAVTLVSLGTSTWYYSIPRTAVVLFPIWIIFGLWMTQRRWFRVAYVVAAAPLLAWVVVQYTHGQWIS